MANLYNVDSPINREERNNLNLTFHDIQSEIGKVVMKTGQIKDEVEGSLGGLQSQIDTLVVEGDSSPEAAQARVGEDGTVYGTLKNRLDTENELLKDYSNNIFITPEFFGALGNGIADDTSALQQAIDSGKDVKLNGTYKISSTININNPIKITSNNGKIILNASSIKAIVVKSSNVKIEGLNIYGQGNTTVRYPETMISVEGTSDEPGNPPSYIKNIEINDCNVNSSGYYGIYAEYVDDLRVLNSKFQNISYCAVGLNSCKNSRVNGNSINSITPGANVGLGVNAYGIFFSQVNNSDVVRYPACENCEAVSNRVNDIPWEGIDTHGGINIRFKDNEVSNTPVGIAIIDADDENGVKIRGSKDIFVDGNKIYNCNSAISTSNITTSIFHSNVVIRGNIVKDCGTLNGGSIVMGYVDGCVIQGNVVENSLTSAVLLRGYVKGSTINGNSFVNMYSNSNSSSAYTCSIYITQDNIEASIEGNSMISKSGFTALKINQYGMYVNGSLVNLNLSLGKNNFESYTVQRYSLTSAQTNNIEPPVVQRGRVIITPTTDTNTVTQNVTLAKRYSSNTLYEPIGSVLSISSNNSLVVPLITKVDNQTISITARTTSGSNFPNTGNIVISWFTSGF